MMVDVQTLWSCVPNPQVHKSYIFVSRPSIHLTMLNAAIGNHRGCLAILVSACVVSIITHGDSPSVSTQFSPVHLALPFSSNGIHDICHCHMDYRLLWPARKDSILGCPECFAAVGTSREAKPKLKSPPENQAWISFRRTYTCNPHFLLPTFYEPVTTLVLQRNRDHGNREMECGI